jgi:nicotinamide-nucleotide amidase
MHLDLVTVGTELLLGQTVDTNSAHIGRTLAAVGVRVVQRTSVSDDPAAIRDAVAQGLARSGFVLTTGGLGPTRDDLTKHVVAELLGMELAFDESVWAALVQRYERLGRVPSPSNRTQAMVPVGGVVLPNQWGTAPGLWLESAQGVVVMLPGVPREMKGLLEHEVLPRLAARGGAGAVIRSRTLRTAGVPESKLGEVIAPLEDGLAPLTVAYLPDIAGVDLRLTAWGLAGDEADARLEAGVAVLREAAGAWIYGEEQADLAEAVLAAARARGVTIAVAESCTGGMVGARLTATPGSSDVFLGGVMAYANAAKVAMLDVPEATIAAHGAVSLETAEAMVRGVAAKFGASVAVAITGVAGPGGGTEAKPVGTVCFAFLVDGEVTSGQVGFPGGRDEVRTRATVSALVGLWRRLRGTALPLGSVAV